jgi:hypothetical protein
MDPQRRILIFESGCGNGAVAGSWLTHLFFLAIRLFGPWDIKQQHSDVELSGAVLRVAKYVRKFGLFSSLIRCAYVARVFWDFLLYSLNHCGEVFISVENDDRRLCIAPGQIAEELVDRVVENLFSSPNLAFSNKDVPAITLEKNIRFPSTIIAAVEGLSG